MPSLVAWLDASSEDQRRMREIVSLFTERESRDELGIGQVRDALSDTLFPGTSTLLTRARYLVLIPWCFVAADRGGGEAAAIAGRVDEYERLLIPALKADGDSEGLLGRVAGRSLKNLPSALYWVALRQFGILSSPGLGAQDAIELGRPIIGRDDEGDGVALGAWSATLPPVPEGFPANTDGGFSLSSAEAGWVRDRISEGAQGSLLAYLVDNSPDADSAAPWFDSTARSAGGEPRVALDHAELFSFGMHGAALLYNLLLAEKYEAAGFDTMSAPVDRYRTRLSDWQFDRSRLSERLRGWDRGDFWRLVLTRNPRVAGASRRFVDDWLDLVIGPTNDLSDGVASRDFIARREASHKRSQARLTNQKLLASWQGASGAGALAFRWPQVKRIMLDIHEGLERDDA
ncbi:MAG: DUF6361 family protein [Actinomycetota bacterium]